MTARAESLATTRRGLVPALALAALIALAPAPATAQTPEPDPTALPGWVLGAVNVSGHASMSGELYHVRGIDARRPASAWRMSLSPQATLLGGFGMGVDAVLSSEGSDLRQNINQLGLHPRWRWVALHVGDFSRPLSDYTVQGTRIRGGGVDLNPGLLRFSIQGGRAQRAVAAGLGGPVYRRSLVAGRVGLGRDDASFFELQLLRAKDDPNSIEVDLVVADTLLLDTIPEGLRPELFDGPQDNLVAGAAGQLTLFRRALSLRAEGAAALTSRDVRSRRISADSTDVPAFVDPLFPVRLSTHGDYAYNLQGTLDLRAVSLRGGYEFIGAGYSSLGLPYLINDRRSYQLGGALRLFQNRVQLQSQFAHQHNNLLEQKLETTNRTSGTVNLSTRLTQRVTAMVGVTESLTGVDAAADSARVDHRARSYTTGGFIQQSLFGRPSVISMTYALHSTTDASPIDPLPGVDVHNVSTSVQLNLGPRVTVAPSVSAVLTRFEAAESQRNIFVGFRGNGRFLEDRLRTSVTVSRTFSSGREVFGTAAHVGYRLPLGTTLAFQLRHNRYSAFALRPGFEESFAGLTLSRSFF